MSEDLTEMDIKKKKEKKEKKIGLTLLERITVFPKKTSRNLLSNRKGRRGE